MKTTYNETTCSYLYSPEVLKFFENNNEFLSGHKEAENVYNALKKNIFISIKFLTQSSDSFRDDLVSKYFENQQEAIENTIELSNRVLFEHLAQKKASIEWQPLSEKKICLIKIAANSRDDAVNDIAEHYVGKSCTEINSVVEKYINKQSLVKFLIEKEKKYSLLEIGNKFYSFEHPFLLT